MTSSTTRGRRRSPGEVRPVVLAAARELFIAAGYDATTTKAICAHAGVSEPLLYSNFGSKEALFEVAVVGPFEEFISDYIAKWEARTSNLSEEDLITEFVTGFFELARRHRALLISCIQQRGGTGPRFEEQIINQLARALQGMQPATISEGAAHGYRDLDPPATIAATAGMVLGVALLDDYLFPAGTRKPSAKRLTDEMRKIILHGIAHRQG